MRPWLETAIAAWFTSDYLQQLDTYAAVMRWITGG